MESAEPAPRPEERDERKGDAEELEKSPSIPPSEEGVPSEQDAAESLPGVPEEARED